MASHPDQPRMEQRKEARSREPATFKGRLQLGDFKYSAPETLPRRNPRRSATSSLVASPVSNTTATAPSQASSREGSTSRQRSSTPPSPAKGKKRKRPSAGYAPPSTYAHLPLLPDAIAPNLLVLFVGLNPGIQTARTGHAYAHPSNLFWKLLFSSGVTPRPCRPDEDREMPALYSLGLTNIVARPSRNGAELSRHEMDDGVALLEDKARAWRPESMCVVGKSIWESIWRVRHGGRPVGRAFRYGWQDEGENMGVIEGEWPGARVFVASSTSGLAAALSLAEKQAIWDELGAWVKMRRAERETEAESEDGEEQGP
ncbi:G/U mismatch-specific uracil DNA glycosylase [Tolypocladium ophioglossoides CBS 100239]|uniref:G/U mismatch-specific uracil DNA glycosylase n=1 Tax=Tolypocladium ophioglossoides (strain CBS 100239) TaxID=1163406 RepID=A0A0L0NCC7_TOLOC|nr:G/U mismatch-specific uracil DNA glycosylase [Tolypocladium ophioglossoides CBS 100239]